MVGINVEVGERTAIGAMSAVLKGTKLDADSIYAGVPVKKMDRATRAAVIETALFDA
jgi:carbonic anhydrase/acetyltransferase-like protein (isoleucine patch superfamily)